MASGLECRLPPGAARGRPGVAAGVPAWLGAAFACAAGGPAGRAAVALVAVARLLAAGRVGVLVAARVQAQHVHQHRQVARVPGMAGQRLSGEPSFLFTRHGARRGILGTAVFIAHRCILSRTAAPCPSSGPTAAPGNFRRAAAPLGWVGLLRGRNGAGLAHRRVPGRGRSVPRGGASPRRRSAGHRPPTASGPRESAPAPVPYPGRGRPAGLPDADPLGQDDAGGVGDRGEEDESCP